MAKLLTTLLNLKPAAAMAFYSATQRLASLEKFNDVPLDLPYKVDKVLEFDKDRKYSAVTL